MGTAFWIRRALTVFALAAAVLVAVRLARGYDLLAAVTYSATWASIATGVFVTGRLYQSRRGQACALCDDIPAGVAETE